MLACGPALLAQTAYFTIDRTGVDVIDPATHEQVAILLAGSRATAMATSPDGNTIYVADSGSRYVTIIDAVHNLIIAEASVGAPIHYIAVSPDNAFLYFVVSPENVHQAIVTKFDLATRKTVLGAVLPQTNAVHSVSVSADGGSLYVPLASTSEQGIAVLDTATLTIQPVIHATKYSGPAFVRSATAWMLCGRSICKIDLQSGTLLAQSPEL